jgi:DNA polymerase-3 subunit chi
MTRVDFYILEGARGDARTRFACRLADKAYQLGNRVYVRTTGPGQSERLDDLLWTLRQDSFVPHEMANAQAGDCPVLIGHDYEPADDRQVLINLGNEVPFFFSRFERVIEIVDDDGRADARTRFSWYRDRGYALEHHRIDTA